MRICVVKTSSMGDVIHTLPALTDAQRAIPNLRVDWVVEKAFAEIPHWHSAVERVIPVEIRRWRKQLCQRQTWREWRAYQKALQAERYDAVIDAQGLLKSALFATRVARGERFGYDYNSAREGLSSLFYQQRFAINYQQHAVERIRQLFSLALNYPLSSERGDYGIAGHFVKSPLESSACRPYIVAVHATTRANKHWLPSYWQHLFDCCGQEGIDVHLPWGNEAERVNAEHLAKGRSQVRVLPKMSLSALATEIAQAQAVVSVDTGLSHLSAGLDKPNIILYGATDPNLIGAYGKNQIYLQADAMARISPEQVWKQLAVLLR